MSKYILPVIHTDIRQAAGSSQLCAGQKGDSEAAIHALNEGVLMVDASNAFNCLDRRAALVNTQHICPTLGIVLANTYRMEPSLFIDGECILSREGTTQGHGLPNTCACGKANGVDHTLNCPEGGFILK